MSLMKRALNITKTVVKAIEESQDTAIIQPTVKTVGTMQERFGKQILPAILDEKGNPIPAMLEELPDRTVFTAMFNRKYGFGGLCPVTIMGQQKLLGCYDTYSFLDGIAKMAEPNLMLVALYGAVVASVLYCDGETFESMDLN